MRLEENVQSSFKMWRIRVSIRTYLVLFQVVLVLLMLATCTLGFFYSYLRTVQGSVLKMTSGIAQVQAQNLVPAVVFGNNKEAQTQLQSLQIIPSVQGASLIDKMGKVIAHIGEAIPEQPARMDVRERMTAFVAHQVVSVEPLLFENEYLGTLIILGSEDSLKAAYWNFTWTAASVGFLGLFMCMLLGTLAQRAFLNPLELLNSFLERVSESNDYSQRFGTQARASWELIEFENLGRHVNEMMQQIEFKDLKLSRANNQLEDRVRERTRELEEAQKAMIEGSRLAALGEMAGNIAHEINNPLAIISGRATQIESCVRKGKLDPKELSSMAESIRSTIERVVRIIRGLRTFSRDGAQDPFERVKVASLITEALELCSARLKNHGVELRAHPVAEDLWIECRPVQIGQVLVNLINNAHDAIEKNEQRWVEILVRDEGAHIQISVTDSGSGIPREIRERMMEPFFTTKEVGKGTGLGLSISRGIVTTHQGDLNIDAECPNTRFVILLPKVQSGQGGKAAA